MITKRTEALRKKLRETKPSICIDLLIDNVLN